MKVLQKGRSQIFYNAWESLVVFANLASFQRTRFFKSSSDSDWYEAITYIAIRKYTHTRASTFTYAHSRTCVHVRMKHSWALKNSAFEPRSRSRLRVSKWPWNHKGITVGRGRFVSGARDLKLPDSTICQCVPPGSFAQSRWRCWCRVFCAHYLLDEPRRPVNGREN